MSVAFCAVRTPHSINRKLEMYHYYRPRLIIIMLILKVSFISHSIQKIKCINVFISLFIFHFRLENGRIVYVPLFTARRINARSTCGKYWTNLYVHNGRNKKKRYFAIHNQRPTSKFERSEAHRCFIKIDFWHCLTIGWIPKPAIKMTKLKMISVMLLSCWSRVVWIFAINPRIYNFKLVLKLEI